MTDQEHGEDFGNEYGDDDSATVSCRYCNEEVYEEALQCPSCSAYDYAARGGQDGALFKVMLFLSVVLALAFAFS